MEYASKGVAGAGLGLGIAGTVLGLMNNGCGGGLLGNTLGVNGGCCGENTAVNRYELNLVQEIAAKDSRIGLLESQVYVDEKLTAVVRDYTQKFNELEREVRNNKDEQGAINLQQAVYNGTNTATISCMQQQIAALQGLTKLVVPNDSVCPGWGAVTVTPAAAGTAATVAATSK